MDIREFLPIGSPREPSIWFGDVGCDPPHSKDPGGVSPMGGETDHGKTTTLIIQQDLELYSIGGGHVGIRTR